MGMKIDVGHGSHFSFNMARIALDAGVVPHTLGADMHGYNTPVPPPPGTPEQHSDQEHMFFGKQRFSLASAMTSMLALGLPLAHVVRMVTISPVEIFGLPSDLGTLRPGNPADVSVLHDEAGRFALTDNEQTTLIATRLLEPDFCLVAGTRYEATAAILPRAERAAA
jgi:dihydroorotase